MKGIIQFLKSILMIGAQTVPAVISAYSPPLGRLTDAILSAVIHAEGIGGPKQGDLKSNIAGAILTEKSDALALAFQAAGKPVKNADLFAQGAQKIQDGVLDILNATGENTK